MCSILTCNSVIRLCNKIVLVFPGSEYYVNYYDTRQRVVRNVQAACRLLRTIVVIIQHIIHRNFLK